MRLVAAMTMALLSLGMTEAADASTVSPSHVNCRAAARANATVLGTLTRGQIVPVLSTSGDWSYVDPVDLPACYVKSAFLTENNALIGQSASFQRTHSATARAPSSRPLRYRTHVSQLTNAATPRMKRSSFRRSRSRAPSYVYSAGSCSCSGSNVCVGPRGGRYCITSGGNKRYGL